MIRSHFRSSEIQKSVKCSRLNIILSGFFMAVEEHNFIYKVYFKGIKKHDHDLINLTFLNDASEVFLENFPNFLLLINEKSRKKLAHSFSNIQEIIPMGNASKVDITQFIAVLYTEKNLDGQNLKQGILIGKIKDGRYKLLGAWPRIVQENKIREKTDYKLKLQEIIEKESNFTDILIIM